MVFKEVESTYRNEDESKENGPKKMEFELNNEGYNSFEEENPSELDDEDEPQTPTLSRFDCVWRLAERYSPLDFHSTFVLSAINDEPRLVKEEVNFEERKLWKKSMVEEMEALEKNEAQDLVKLTHGRKLVGSKWVFKKKLNVVGKVKKYKAQLIEKVILR